MNFLFYGALVILVALAYLAYGFRGAFWTIAVIFIPLLILLSSVTYFAKMKLMKLIKKHPHLIDRIADEIAKEDKK